jgi:hypothetical protein
MRARWARRANARQAGSTRLPMTPLALAALLLLLAACSSAGTKVSATAATSPTATRAAQATATPAATVVAIADLNTFRTTLAAAFMGGAWPQVAALMSPAFTFEGTGTGGTQLVMPTAGSEFNTLYTSNLSWSQQDASRLSLYRCFAGSTPDAQLMLFRGKAANNVLAMVGIQRWQGYWVLAWAFQDTADSSGYCL